MTNKLKNYIMIFPKVFSLGFKRLFSKKRITYTVLCVAAWISYAILRKCAVRQHGGPGWVCASDPGTPHATQRCLASDSCAT